ncbi:MAG: 1-deoxy-D-xylulose-5-phosphate reductoisomerase [Verrucomicrobiota bacterium]|nr:1-deoxy-D-xylulose-5-phosphate reductoisomerase [Verrucomicrobiota bacterium]
MKRKRVVVLGATGSIGDSALKVARDLPDRMEIVGLAAKGSAAKLAAQANEFRPEAVCIVEEAKLDELRASLTYAPEIFVGEAGLREIAALPNAEMVLIAVVGIGGLRPALAAIAAGKDLAVASKEILVMAGEIVMGAAAKKRVRVLPVDSEHNAIFQCLESRLHDNIEHRTSNTEHRTGETESSMFDVSAVRRLILTASGGPFRETPARDFAAITPAQALRHPTWSMGPKITIDSATLFNKGLEMIEARWLFNVEMKRVEVIVHPQSIVHSMVEFADGSILAQLSHSDMCFPIQYAVTWPERIPNSLAPLDFGMLRQLDFATPRYDDFPALNLARRAGEAGGTLPAVLNAANEVAVSAFLQNRISFPGIWQLVEKVMNRHASIADAPLDAILAADQWARTEAAALARVN